MFFIKKVVVYVLSITSLLLIHNALMAKTPVAILCNRPSSRFWILFRYRL